MNCYPVDYINITQPYSSTHQAIDLGWWGDTSDRPIYSVFNGEVITIRNDYKTKDTSGSSYGNYIIIKNEDNSKSVYAHLKYKSCLVKVGDKVKQHQQIATMGETGRATAPHLHYEHRINDKKENPFNYLYKFEYQEINYKKDDSKYIKIKPEKIKLKFKVGDIVKVNGYLHKNAFEGAERGIELTNYVSKISLIYDKSDGVYLYNIGNDYLGWVKESDLELYEEPKENKKVNYLEEIIRKIINIIIDIFKKK